MMFAVAGIAMTLFGLYCGEAVAERWKLGTLAVLSIGWMLGMVFVITVFIIGAFVEAP